MDHRSLSAFLTLAEMLHFSRASEKCHMSLPTLSRTIKRIEDEVGSPLFIRDNRRVELTAAGMAFKNYAQQALDNWSRLKLDIAEADQVLAGQLSVFCSVTASYSYLYQLLNQFRKRHSQVEIQLHTGDAAAAMSRVQANTEQVAIAARPDVMPQNVIFKLLGSSSLVFIGPSEPCALQQQLDNSPALTSEVLKSIPFIISESGFIREQLNSWFKQNKISPPIYAQVAGNEAIVSMVSLGLGVALVPKIVIQTSPLAEKIRVLPIEHTINAFEIGLVTLQRHMTNPVVKALWSMEPGGADL